jgi:hypothetical protein
MLKIEKNVPLPDGHLGGVRKKYPFTEMAIGDSLFMACSADRQQKTQNSLLGAALRHKPMKFCTRKVRGGVRIWRTA